jgi:ribosomal protein S18 acetylase RimI-like enzyme
MMRFLFAKIPMSNFPDETEQISLRPALPSDELLLFKLYASTRLEEFSMVPWNEAQLEAFLKMQFDAQRRTYRMQYPAADHHIILKGAQEMGRLMVHRTVDDILLIDITLLPEFRGRGIGGKLLGDLQSEATLEGKRVRLHVLRTNPARRLYERSGFSTIGGDSMYEEMLWQPSNARRGVHDE